ncbi:low molecular weight phosphotyrosine protein phosphatase [Thalassotalea sp. M1531]|uniref:protein-tyrosine-phosphatase n=1 Tax=Thalassotalea algicola TaxID=2716224 RepID=A0A7Y0LE87_9GAMM|nr:low molecular weight protein-tyrosine-phosphatase [Thalassotalea algicola]NMP31540.1 low molecular weight phosphotyrosine protein phosphatase [Thalassotalea algicola]
MDANQPLHSILFVCMGNICRSPTAEAVFRDKATQAGLSFELDSAGTIGSHAREKPDHRAIKAGNERGYSFEGIKARKVTIEDFDNFDLILAMDNKNLEDLIDFAPVEQQYKVKLFLDFAANYEEAEVPDPYYGGAGGFKFVLDLVEDASDGLIATLKS